MTDKAVIYYIIAFNLFFVNYCRYCTQPTHTIENMNPSMLEEDEHFLISLERNAEVISKRFSLEPHELDSSTVRDDEVSFHSSGEAKDESSFEALQQKHFEEQKTGMLLHLLFCIYE